MIAAELDEFDMFMLRHSAEFRRAVNKYLDAKTIDGEPPTKDMVLHRAKTMKSFTDYMLRERGVCIDEPSQSRESGRRLEEEYV